MDKLNFVSSSGDDTKILSKLMLIRDYHFKASCCVSILFSKGLSIH
jgi:hypothetical protein